MNKYFYIGASSTKQKLKQLDKIEQFILGILFIYTFTGMSDRRQYFLLMFTIYHLELDNTH